MFIRRELAEERYSLHTVMFVLQHRRNLGRSFGTSTRMLRIGCVAWQNRSQKDKFVEIISPAKGYFRETYKPQNINT